MAELSKMLHIKTNGVEQTAKIYSTEAEAGLNYIKCLVDGEVGYIPIGETSDALATAARVKKNGTTCAIKSGAVEYTKILYDTAGSQKFTVPAGITAIAVTAAGAGGGGGGYAYNEYAENGDGGSGGRGDLVIMNVISVTPLAELTVTVGPGGAVGKSQIHGGTYCYYGTSGSAGGASSVGSVSAAGGGGGGGSPATSSTHGYIGSGSAGSDAGNGRGAYGGSGGSVQTRSTKDDTTVKGTTPPKAGNSGWVVIEYGGVLTTAGYKTESYTKAGTYYFTVPKGVKSIGVELSDGGGGYTTGSKGNYDGTAGALGFDFVDVVPGDSYSIVVGAGGESNASGGASEAFGLKTSTAKSYKSEAGANGGTSSSTTGSDGWVTLKYWG